MLRYPGKAAWYVVLLALGAAPWGVAGAQAGWRVTSRSQPTVDEAGPLAPTADPAGGPVVEGGPDQVAFPPRLVPVPQPAPCGGGPAPACISYYPTYHAPPPGYYYPSYHPAPPGFYYPTYHPAPPACPGPAGHGPVAGPAWGVSPPP
jgi:hypothetical protein